MRPPADPGEWYVAFNGLDRMGWWDWFLTRPGFRHTFAFAYSSHALRWIVYDVMRDRTIVRAYRRRAFDVWMAQLPAETIILRVTAAPMAPMRLHRAIFDCVSAVKHLIGSRSRALRPEALCRDLLAIGATYAFGTGPKHEEAESHISGGGPGGQGRASG